MKTRTPLLALLASLPLVGLSLTACGGGDPGALTDEGYTALSSGDYSGAQSKFEGALSGLAPDAPRYLEAKIGLIRAKAHNDASAATAEFLTLAKATTVDSKHYRSVVIDLTDAGGFEGATEILKAGKEAHPDYDKWQELIQKVGDRAKSAGDEGVLASLKGLGYVGD